MKLALIRPPQQSNYNDLDLREDNLISYFWGYSEAVGLDLDFNIYDFVLDKTNTLEKIMEHDYDQFILFVRETGSCPHYAVRITQHLIEHGKQVILYGHVARFLRLKVSDLDNVTLIEHDEKKLCSHLYPSLKVNENISFESGFTVKPYFHLCNISEKRLPLFKASLESTRGCEFKCKFCYINHGDNHAERWVTRDISVLLSDIDVYYKSGIRNFVFMDSEFIGRSKQRQVDLLYFSQEVKLQFSDINFMIYARADTIAKFNSLEELKEAGLVNVFVGVESFYERDLIAMNKGVRSERLIQSIKKLIDMKVFMTLSFITFNRETTIKSLGENLKVLKELYSLPDSKFLGMPNFIFNFESSWDGNGKNKLSNKTYIKWLLYFKEQPGYSNAVFDTKLEPIMEICRILHYEITKKIAELNYFIEIEPQVLFWFDSIGLFAIGVMETFLDHFKNGSLSLESILDNTKEFYELMRFYNDQTLPKDLRTLLTLDETLTSQQQEDVQYLDHGWDHAIPNTKASLNLFVEAAI
ncbi:Radical SAM domain protein [Moritella sp. JT01]|uniref:radical SAM protein n=1 Tax=Moritella sp. JT01 TaxID=756698 RepID=UPI0007948B33|nr:radical SAM protein [Moritella sp. JT01]KXO11550.1 Radical SAM domain protein [Moritella sp. JT01]